jgi:hypothetical protein
MTVTNKNNPFRGGQGHWLMKRLFLETCQGEMDKVMYSLHHDDREYNGKVYPSFRRLYVELEDPTEYRVATELLGGWEHWKLLCNRTLKNHVEAWREELDIRMQANGVVEMSKLSKAGDRMASKFLAEKGYVAKRKAGAPSKEEKEAQLKNDKKVAEVAIFDMERLGLVNE